MNKPNPLIVSRVVSYDDQCAECLTLNVTCTNIIETRGLACFVGNVGYWNGENMAQIRLGIRTAHALIIEMVLQA